MTTPKDEGPIKGLTPFTGLFSLAVLLVFCLAFSLVFRYPTAPPQPAVAWPYYGTTQMIIGDTPWVVGHATLRPVPRERVTIGKGATNFPLIAIGDHITVQDVSHSIYIGHGATGSNDYELVITFTDGTELRQALPTNKTVNLQTWK